MHAFVSLPFEKIFDPVFETLAKVAMLRGLVTCRTQPARASTAPLAQATTERHIRNSHFIIADLTGNDPNVEREVRDASKLGTPCILISQEAPEKAAFHLHGCHIHQYDVADLESLQSALLQSVVALSGAVENRLTEAPRHGAIAAKISIKHIVPGQWHNPFVNG